MGSEIVGQTIADGRYEIIEKLGEGAMGEVYRARQVAVGRMVALKLIHVDAGRSVETTARFQREMKLTAKIEHANTVRVYDFGTWQGQLYLAMELLRGKTLRDELTAAGRFPLARIVHVARQITRALAAAHAEGIVHRDLKPENVMLLEQYGERDLVKVLDFGIAKSFDEPDEVRMTGAGAIIGTPAYMSPEQAMGQRVDPRSDLYTLGIMLFEMASGRVPFEAPSLTAMLVAHATQEPPPLAQFAPDVQPELAKLVADLLHKDPNQRPQTVQELDGRLAGLEQAQRTRASQLGEARTMMAGTELQPPVADAAGKEQGSRALWFMLASVLLGGGAATALWVSRAPSNGQPPPPVHVPLPEAPRSAAEREEDKAIDLAVLGATAGSQLAAAGLPNPPESCSAEARTYAAFALVNARQFLESDPKEAADWALKALDKCPSWAAALNIQGNALQAANKLEEAGEAYARALQEAPDYDAARFNLGVLQLRRKDPAAIDTFTELLKQKPSYPDVHKSRAQAYLFAKRYQEGLADLEEELKADPEDGTVWLMVGQLRTQLKLKGADDAYCEAAKRNVEEARALCKGR